MICRSLIKTAKKFIKLLSNNNVINNIPDKERQLLVLIDQDNIDSHLRNRRQKLDYAQLMLEFRKMGRVNHAYVFIPFNSYYSLENINSLGYRIQICQKMDKLLDSEKREDKVDSQMQSEAEDFFRYREITDIIILTHDRHSIETSAEALKEGKTITYFAIKEEIGKELLDFINEYKIPINPLPTKDRGTF